MYQLNMQKRVTVRFAGLSWFICFLDVRQGFKCFRLVLKKRKQSRVAVVNLVASCGVRSHSLHLPAIRSFKVQDETNYQVCRNRAHEEIIHLTAVNDYYYVSVYITGIIHLCDSCPSGTHPCCLADCLLGPFSEFIPQLSPVSKLHLTVQHPTSFLTHPVPCHFLSTFPKEVC